MYATVLPGSGHRPHVFGGNVESPGEEDFISFTQKAKIAKKEVARSLIDYKAGYTIKPALLIIKLGHN